MRKSTFPKNVRRAIAVLLCAVFVFCAVPAGALENNSARSLTVPRLNAPILRAGESAASTFPSDTSELRSYLFEQLYSCPQSVDVSSFNIPDTEENRNRLEDLVWFNLPECFQVNGLGVYGDGGIIRKLFASYYYSAEKYDLMFREVNEIALEMTNDVKAATWLTDAQKALIIHDRLDVRCEYDYANALTGTVPIESYMMYGALVNRMAVCTGYTWAYMYMLRLVGIENYYTTSDYLNHAWNIVTINGKKYHVDTTWDDPTFDMTGHVKHSFFLVSTSGLKAERVERGITDISDYDTSPNSRDFEGYFWNDSQSEFLLIGSSVYYFDSANTQLCKWDASGRKAIKTVADKWYASSTGYWKGNYTRIASDGKRILYSTSKSVFSYDPATGKTETVYSPEKAKSGYINIYGFTLLDDYLICDVGNTPNYTLTTKNEIMIKVPYDVTAPVGSISSTNDVASSQTVTLDMSDKAQLAGYYWGTYSDYTKNTYKKVAGTSASVTEKVSARGTYYLNVKDANGNVSAASKITFYETVLDCCGGEADVDRIITESGKDLSLPKAKKSGIAFRGWSKAKNGAVAENDITVTGNSTYYALWIEPQITISAKSLTLTVGASAIIYASTNVDTDEIEWTSSDESSVVVKDGRVTAVNSGSATIAAQIMYDDVIYSAACEVIVKNKRIAGDVNGDSKLNAVDTNLMKQIITNLTVPDADGFAAADLNGDGKVNAVDSNLLKQLILGN